jgi:hypothetical protein
MSSNRLDSVKTFDQFGHDHWKALGTKLGGVEVVKAILRETAVVIVEPVRLTALTSSVVEACEVNVKEFFADRAGLSTTDYFKKYILADVSEVNVSATETIIGYADLTQVANDAKICGELPKDHVFEKVDTFLVHLATLIKGQWGGQKGDLLNNAYANIFYVKKNGAVFAVTVRWFPDVRGCRCYASRLGDSRWSDGYRVFSATAA